MKIIRNITTQLPPLALTIGNFDGVHLGHLQIINQVKKVAADKKLASAILTFQPHPITFLRPDLAKDFNIFTLSQKLKIFSKLGIDYAIILPFNQKFADINAKDFIQEVLLKALNTKHLTIGYDFTFGKNREGNFKMLEQSNLDLQEIAPIKNLDITCSSTIIRKFISSGEIAKANEILGKNFTISGLVNEGRKLGSQLGFATANLQAKPHIIKPKFGVYKSAVFIPHLQQRFSAITNFGIKPTLQKNCNTPLFETHILQFSEQLYGKKIYIELLDFIREEKKFSSLEELKTQIKQDVATLI